MRWWWVAFGLSFACNRSDRAGAAASATPSATPPLEPAGATLEIKFAEPALAGFNGKPKVGAVARPSFNGKRLRLVLGPGASCQTMKPQQDLADKEFRAIAVLASSPRLAAGAKLGERSGLIEQRFEWRSGSVSVSGSTVTVSRADEQRLAGHVDLGNVQGDFVAEVCPRATAPDPVDCGKGDRCRVTAIGDADVEKMKNVKELVVSDEAGDADLATVARVPWIKSLTVDGKLDQPSDVTDLSVVAKLPQLELLYVHRTRVASLAALAGHKRLWMVTVGSAAVTDVAPLASVPNLRSVDIAGSAVTDVMSLTKVKTLAFLSVGGDFPSDRLEAFKKARADIDVRVMEKIRRH